MIEKIMKSLKSGNKKRSLNISIGAVVGFLLSCTAVMGASGNYLWISAKDGTIKFSAEDGGGSGNWRGNPYAENVWNEAVTTYTNNMTLSGKDNGKNEFGNIIGYGVKLDVSGLSFINNGNISGSGSGYGYGYGIFGSSGVITNYGNIAGSSSDYGYGYGISDSSGVITNYGNIAGRSFGYGISDSSGVITNYGNIVGRGSGILDSSGVITNYGNIAGSSSGSDEGLGVRNFNAATPALLNTGVIYGTIHAIFNGNGTISNAINYGILANGKSSKGVVNSSITIVKVDDGKPLLNPLNLNTIYNYGLIFTADGNYKATEEEFKKFGTTSNGIDVVVDYEKDINGVTDFKKPITEKYTIINAKADGTAKDNITKTKSLKMADGKLTYEDKDTSLGDKVEENLSTKKYILNGITDTLLVSGNSKDNTLANSVINAYGTAVKFDETSGGTLSLSGTVVSGGIDGTSNVISGNDGVDILKLENTVVNGNINMGSEADTLTVGTGTIINGTLDGGLGDDTLNFVKSPTTRLSSSTNDSINILHNISGFENMNINANATLFETTIDKDGKSTDLTVTGVNNLTIGAGGVLTLRIDSANGNTHALSTGNTGIIKSENGGKLLLALNGAGNTRTISFGNLTLDGSLVTGYEGEYQEEVTFDTTSPVHSVERGTGNEIIVRAKKNLPLSPTAPDNLAYEKLNEIYHSLCSPLVNGLVNFNIDDEGLVLFLDYLNNIYTGNPYSYSSELSRKSAVMFRDIVTEKQFKADTGKWLIHGGLTHVDGGTKDTYFGKNYYDGLDVGSSDIDNDTKITGAYMLGEYGVSDTLTSGVVIGGNKLKSDLSNGSKVEGNAMYLGAYAKKYLGNLKVTAGAGFQYGDYDADRLAVNNVASDTGIPVMKYSDNYNDMTYDIYINGRYSHNIGDNLFLEPYGTLSYTYVDQDGADEGSKILAIETDSKSFDYTTAKAGIDLKKVIPHEKGKSTVSAGVSYTRILDGADEEFITGRFKGGTDFDILVAHKNEHSIGLNAKYSLELENGILFDVKGTYGVERDSHNQSGKNKNKGEWIVGTGLGYKF